MDEYIVYAKLDGNGVVVEINSSAFLGDISGWTEIDRGVGDKFHHAQSAYLTNGIADEDGIYNYKLESGELALRSESEKAPERAKLLAAEEIAALKENLADTDYISAKIADGAATREEYADKLAERAAWRSRINELEAMI